MFGDVLRGLGSVLNPQVERELAAQEQQQAQLGNQVGLMALQQKITQASPQYQAAKIELEKRARLEALTKTPEWQQADPQGKLKLAAAAGVIDPLAYAKEQDAASRPMEVGGRLVVKDPTAPNGYRVVIDKPIKPMVEHNYPVPGDKVQPHISYDEGKTWQPIPGSVASPKYARQVAPIVQTGDHSAYTNVQPDGQGGYIGLSKKTGKMEVIPKGEGVKPPGVWGDAEIELAAARYRMDGTLPPNLGRGMQGVEATRRIVAKAAAMASAEGDSPEATRLNQIATRADTQALGQLTKQKNLVLAFEKNAVANADIVLNESKKVDRLGSPAIDRWILAGKKSIAGDAAVARLDTAIRTFVNEYARVTTSVTGGGITSDTARKEIESLLQSKNTPEQVVEVVNLMKQEMNNRKVGYEQQEAEIKAGILARVGKKPAAAPSANTSASLPSMDAIDAELARRGRK